MSVVWSSSLQDSREYAGTGEVACRRRQSCEASSGEVDGMGLFLGQAAWPTGSAEDRLRQRPGVPRSTTSLAASSPRGRSGGPWKSGFQQDNAKIHTAKLMLSFFDRYAVPLESHPAYSSGPESNRARLDLAEAAAPNGLSGTCQLPWRPREGEGETKCCWGISR